MDSSEDLYKNSFIDSSFGYNYTVMNLSRDNQVESFITLPDFLRLFFLAIFLCGCSLCILVLNFKNEDQK